MQKMSFRKLSILGLVLMAASAITAAIVPSGTKEVNGKLFYLGSLTYSTTDWLEGFTGYTCTESLEVTSPCNITEVSGTTEVLNGSSDQNGENSTVNDYEV